MIKSHIETKVTPESYDTVMDFIMRQIDGMCCLELYEIVTAAQELVINVFEYAYEKGKEGNIYVDCMFSPENYKVELVLRDNGKPFDPTRRLHEITNIRLTSLNGEVKGLGILIADRFTTKISYKRENDQNILTMLKYYSGNQIIIGGL